MTCMRVDEEKFRTELLKVGFSYTGIGMILAAFQNAEGIFETMEQKKVE